MFGRGQAVLLSNSFQVFAEAKALGFKPDFLDIGGGFPGSQKDSMMVSRISNELNSALSVHFPEEDGVKVIICL